VNRILRVCVVAMMVLGFACIASADVAVRVRANIPFAFYAESKLMPAGNYMFDIGSIFHGNGSGSAVLIHNEAGDISAWLFTKPGQAMHATNVRLQFSQYGDECFLKSVEGLGYQADLQTSKAEKELIAQGKQKREKTLILAN